MGLKYPILLVWPCRAPKLQRVVPENREEGKILCALVGPAETGLDWVGRLRLLSLLLGPACLDVCWAACQLTCQVDVTAPGWDPEVA